MEFEQLQKAIEAILFAAGERMEIQRLAVVLETDPDEIEKAADALADPPERLRGFHIMVCNPPYITGPEMGELDRSVADFEPHLALYGGADGLDFYRSVARRWMGVMLPGGTLYFECGWKQAAAVADLFAQEGFSDIRIEEDYAGVQRIVIVRLPY